MALKAQLTTLFDASIKAAFPQLPVKAAVVASTKGGDYQCNNALTISGMLKKAGQKDATPDTVATAILSNLSKGDVIDDVSATKGFININIKRAYVAQMLKTYVGGHIQPPAVDRQCILVDFSSPNVAKDMHVGHLRSTIIGECICRVLEYLGHKVLRINHVGDWGTQFGMLIAHLKDTHPDFLSAPPALGELVVFYKAAKKRFDEDSEFKARAHQEVVALQGGDETNFKAWKCLCNHSREAFEKVYERLSVTSDWRGESFYNSMLADVVQDCLARNLAHESNGAVIIVSKERHEVTTVGKVLKDAGALAQKEGKEGINVAKDLFVPLEDFSLRSLGPEKLGRALQGVVEKLRPKKGTLPAFVSMMQQAGLLQEDGGKQYIEVPMFANPCMIRKSDGGFNYDTTDLAGVKYRATSDQADRCVYVTDLGQEPHFQLIFQAAHDAGYDIKPSGERVQLQHVGFGMVCGEDGKKYKTRSGETVKLTDLLDRAPELMYEISKEREDKKPEDERIPEDMLRRNADVVGYGAVKYFDLKNNRVNNYKFDYDAMLSVDGNTNVYLQYAYVRILSVLRKAQFDFAAADADLLPACESDASWALCLHLSKYLEVVQALAEECCPHKLCEYLYQTTQIFTNLYTKEKFLDNPRLLLLATSTAAVLKHGLNLLGISVCERL